MRLNGLLTQMVLCSMILWYVVFSIGCGAENPQETVELRVGSDIYRVEVARSPEERQTGLMNREELGEFEGMLFVFERDQQLSFWMKDTLVPLSIAYLGKDGTIKEMYDMTPLSTRPVGSRFSARYALELPQGAFERSGARVGDRIDLSALDR